METGAQDANDLNQIFTGNKKHTPTAMATKHTKIINKVAQIGNDNNIELFINPPIV